MSYEKVSGITILNSHFVKRERRVQVEFVMFADLLPMSEGSYIDEENAERSAL